MKNSKNNKIKAIVFDFGGVIELYEGPDTAAMVATLLGVPIAKIKEVYFQHNHLSNVENLDRADVWAKVASIFDTTKENQVREMVKAQAAERKINVALLDLFPKIRQLGLKAAVFSNANKDLRQRLGEIGVMSLVDEIVISGEIGFQKPHKEAFQVLFDRLGVQAQEVVFIDDSPKSLEKASEIGYTPILFKNNAQLKIDLKKVSGVAL